MSILLGAGGGGCQGLTKNGAKLIAFPLELPADGGPKHLIVQGAFPIAPFGASEHAISLAIIAAFVGGIEFVGLITHIEFVIVAHRPASVESGADGPSSASNRMLLSCRFGRRRILQCGRS